ncbi:MAG: tyrosine-type recombinase/integrase [Verrucomicrobia bacterium]|nr:tyrosine-type recombinase/integrase [Cytophagales bacterium]
MDPDLYTFVDNPKHKALLVLLAQLPVKVSQLTALTWADFDLIHKTLTVSAKSKQTTLPVSATAYQILASLAAKHPPGNKDELLFSYEGKPISRQAVFKIIRKAEEKSLSAIPPSAVRGNGITDSQQQAFAPWQQLKATVGKLENLTSFFTKKEDSFIRVPDKKGFLLVGRELETDKITKLLSANISLVITGAVGIGKTALLEAVCQKLLQTSSPPLPTKILEIDDCTSFKTSVAGILLYLFEGDKEAVMRMFFSVDSKEKLAAKVSKESLANLCKILCSITQKHEYLLKIGDIDRITPTAVKALEILAPHFVIITTAREIKLRNATFLWHFERIELKPFNRLKTIELIKHLFPLDSPSFRGDSNALVPGRALRDEAPYLMSRIWDISAGNPKMIVELCDRFSREAIVDAPTIEAITSGYLGKQIKEIDMSIAFLLLFGALTIFRFAAAEVGNPSLRFIGGIFIIVLLFARPFLSAFKRKNL